MPNVKANGITIHYEQQGNGESLILLPHLAADNACYTFQLADYKNHFNCIAVDLRGTGESDKPSGEYSTADVAEDVAAFMQALGIMRAHIAGVSFGAAVGMCLASKHPERVKSLSLHAAWHKTDPFLLAVVHNWQLTARALNNVADTLIQAIFPWCLTPETYAARPEYIQALSDFVRSRPAQPLQAFLQQSDAVMDHDAESLLEAIVAPTQITTGSHDLLTARFAKVLNQRIRNSELVIFENCSHATIYENVEEFNKRTLEFLRGRAMSQAA